MSVALDANVLLYASDSSSEFHERALKTLHESAEGRGLLYLFWPVVKRANVRTPGEAQNFLQIFHESTAGLIVRGNLVPDAHVVALMRQYEVNTIISHDRDFRKFNGIKAVDPFQ